MAKKEEIANYNPQDESVVIYRSEDDSIRLDVQLANETVWLNRHQMALLFDRDIKTIGKHINNALREELSPVIAKSATTHLADNPVVAKFATTATDGKTYQVEHYNLDVVISVGYRVKSNRGVAFRRWANSVLKDYLLKGYAVNQRLLHAEERIDRRLLAHEKRLESVEQKIDFFVRTSLPPVEGIFYDGQIFDAYSFASDLVREAKKRIVLIDNYVDDSVFTLLDKREKGVSAAIYTHTITPQLKLDLKKHNAQYAPIDVQQFTRSHDRFLCIDDTVYHLGASLKDLGKKWFAFNRMEITTDALLTNMK